MTHQTVQENARQPRAVLWDMDGTSSTPSRTGSRASSPSPSGTAVGGATSRPCSWSGATCSTPGAYIREHMGIDRTPHQIVEEPLDGVVARVQQAVPWQPGARELLVALRADGLACALVTMPDVRFVEPILAQLPPGTFAEVVTGDAVARGKPHPDPYLLAAERLGLPPEDCLAIEDSDPGTRSATAAAGCPTLVVPNHVAVPTGPRRVFRDSLVGLVPADLAAIHAEGTSSTSGTQGVARS